MKGKIKNYTTSVPVPRTIIQIEDLLAGFGASAVAKKYENGRVCAIFFQLETEFGERSFKLPANVKNVYMVLTHGREIKSEESWRMQAERVAWRVIKDWLHAQLSLVQIGQAKPEQVFLPYMHDGTETLYERMEKTMLMLPEPDEGHQKVIAIPIDEEKEE